MVESTHVDEYIESGVAKQHAVAPTSKFAVVVGGSLSHGGRVYVGEIFRSGFVIGVGEVCRDRVPSPQSSPCGRGGVEGRRTRCRLVRE